MSGNKKKFQLRWIVGLLLVAAFEFYTWRNGRSVDDYGMWARSTRSACS